MADAQSIERMTAEQFYESHAGRRAELVDGQVIEAPPDESQDAPAGPEHAIVTLNIGWLLKAFLRDHDLGFAGVELGFILARNPDVVRAPDVCVVAHPAAEAARATKGLVEGAPDLAVEVASPSDSLVDLEAQADAYLAAGTRLVWVVNPTSRRVFIYRGPDHPVRVLGPGQTLDAPDVLPGWSAPVDALFE